MPRGERSGIIGRMIAEIDKAAGRSTTGKGIEVPERVDELYADVVRGPRPLEHELANVLRGGGDSVFHERPEAPRWRFEVAADRSRIDAHFGALDAIGLIGEAPRLEHFATAPVCIQGALVPVGSLDPLTFVKGSFTLLSSPLVTRDRSTVVGSIELRDVALQPGTLVELPCDSETPTPEKCDKPPCEVCMHRWRLHVFEGDSAGPFVFFNRSMPWKRKFRLTQVARHASFRRPVVSVDGISNAQCASGEPPEGAGKTLILDPRFPDHVRSARYTC